MDAECDSLSNTNIFDEDHQVKTRRLTQNTRFLTSSVGISYSSCKNLEKFVQASMQLVDWLAV
jgi:hypothetical protein